MPLAYRTILPVWLGRRPLTEEEDTEELAPIAVCHNAFLGAIVQLASLVRHADDIFCDLAEECQRVFEKTDSISNKLKNIERIITKLDSTEVTIPVGTLKQFTKQTDHHVAKHGFDCDHFTPSNRPYCIRFNYSMGDLTPVHALRGVDPLRKDGQISSHLFKLWPITLKDMEMPMDDLKIPRRYSSPLASKKRYKSLKVKDRRRTIHSIEEIYHKEASDLQASKNENLSKSQPSILVSVDTSGTGFERMALFRQSLSGDDIRVKKKRRRTVSGVPENIMHEIEQFEEDRRISRDRPRMYSLDDLDQKELDARDEVMQQYLLEMDSAIADREEEEYAEQREKKLLKFIPCRRTRSLPRCVKLLTARGREELTLSSMFPKKLKGKHTTQEIKLKHATDGPVLQDKFSSSAASLGSLSSDDAKSSKRSSLIGNKIKSLVSSTLKPRPKSLDFDSIEVIDHVDKQPVSKKLKSRSASLSGVSSQEMPEGTLSQTRSNESQVRRESYYYFDSNTLPRAQAKKYDFPWDSLPKDWTTSVKLREISRRRKEDRQSSSGNWSQSGGSSNRQSLDSNAKSSMPSSMSQYSLGKDSGRDSPHSTGERDGLDPGYMGDAASTESVSDTKSISNTDSDDWIRSLAEQAANREDVTSTSAEALANLSRLTKQNIRNLDILVPGRTLFRQRRNELEDDGESSVYSIDQEGFYTSFHSDSGLKRSTNTLLNDEDDDLMMPRISQSRSMQSMTYGSRGRSVLFRPDTTESSLVSSMNKASMSVSDIPLSAVIESDISDIDFPEHFEGEVEYGEYGTLKAKNKTKKKRRVPPLPPPRTTSISGNDNCSPDVCNEGQNSLDDSPSSIETSSESSDHETIYARLKKKTGISAHTYPPWCVGIASDEDDFQDRLNAESSEIEELFSGKDNWLPGTLPRATVPTEIKNSTEFDQTANSWPRVKRWNPPQLGILKTHEKDKYKPLPSNPKVLNFDPVVNLFDACSPHGVQMPLSRLSSSDESSSPSTFDTNPLNHHKNSLSLSLNGQENTEKEHSVNGRDSLPRKKILSKHQLSTTTTHESTRPRSMVLPPREFTNSSTPVHRHPSTLHSGKVNFSPNDLSGVHSSSIDLTDSFDAPLVLDLSKHEKSDITLTSNSTIALSDIDTSSLTNVTMSDSSPSGSSLSLNWDTDDTPNPTPMATPVRKHVPWNLFNSTSSTKPTVNKNVPVTSDSLQFVTSAQQLNVPSSLDQTIPSTSSSNQNIEEYGVSQHMRSSPPISGPVQSESDIVHTTSHQFPGQSIPYKTSSMHIQPMELSNFSFNTVSSSISDRNNNRNKAANIAISESTVFKQDFCNQNTMDKKNFPHTDSLPQSSHVHNCTNSSSLGGYYQQQQQQSINPVRRTSYSERRRSSPNMVHTINSAGSNGNEDSSGFKINDSSNSAKRRQSDNKLYSPADSGYGSPSVSNQPNATTNTFLYSPSQTNQQHFSLVPPQSNSTAVSSNSSMTPLIKEPLLWDSKTTLPNFVSKTTSVNINSTVKPDYAGRVLRQTSSESIESLVSQFSVSSTQQLISKMQTADLPQPELHRENSTESVHSNGSGGRSDSYRVAMLVENDEASLIPNKMPIKTNSISSINNNSLPKNTPGMYQPRLTKSMTVPAPAVYEDDGRADSYRCAVRNTQSMILGDAFGRNTSYRLATCEEDVLITDNRMDACNLWSGKTGTNRDVRRMGITDIDQLKHYSNEPENTEKSGDKNNIAKMSNTPHAKKKLSTKTENEVLTNQNKSSSIEHKRFMRSSNKDKTKQKTQSSTYIRFDPIFESGEDLRASSESLRPPSIVSIRTLAKTESNETITSDNANLIKQRVSSASPSRRRSNSHGRREDKSSLSIFESIKTTIKSIGSTKGE